MLHCTLRCSLLADVYLRHLKSFISAPLHTSAQLLPCPHRQAATYFVVAKTLTGHQAGPVSLCSCSDFLCVSMDIDARDATLYFTDNGVGMSPRELSTMLSFGITHKGGGGQAATLRPTIKLRIGSAMSFADTDSAAARKKRTTSASGSSQEV